MIIIPIGTNSPIDRKPTANIVLILINKRGHFSNHPIALLQFWRLDAGPFSLGCSGRDRYPARLAFPDYGYDSLALKFLQ